MGVEVKGRLWERTEREERDESVYPDETAADTGGGAVLLE
jgi:hypothetical protein